jgi:hypothetical protein
MKTTEITEQENNTIVVEYIMQYGIAEQYQVTNFEQFKELREYVLEEFGQVSKLTDYELYNLAREEWCEYFKFHPKMSTKIANMSHNDYIELVFSKMDNQQAVEYITNNGYIAYEGGGYGDYHYTYFLDNLDEYITIELTDYCEIEEEYTLANIHYTDTSKTFSHVLKDEIDIIANDTADLIG